VATTSEWIQGARPRTLPAALAPIAVGTGIAIGAGAFDGLRAALALIVAVALQIAVNYSNDYSDGIRGTDQIRVGPVRLVGQKLAKPHEVKRAAFIFFGLAMISGTILVVLTTQWWLFAVGAASITAAWFYTGGSRPYGYAGFGELFVFLFFGIVPVMGTAYVQTLQLSPLALWAGVGVGSLACSILITNNVRDIPGDLKHNKLTLAVRLGDRNTRRLFYVSLIIGFVVPVAVATFVTPFALLALIAAPLAVGPVRLISTGVQGPALIPVLKLTGLILLVYGLGFGSGLALGG